MDAQLSHIANATSTLFLLQTAQPTSSLNKRSGSLHITFGGTCVYTADMNTFNANKLAALGPINFLPCREACLSIMHKVQPIMSKTSSSALKNLE